MTHNIDLDTLSLEQLKSLQQDLARQIESYETRKRSEAAKKTAEFAAQFGYSLEELLETTKSRTSKSPMTVKPKYRNPEDPNVTWSGRGRMPVWMVKKLEEGANAEDFLIKKI
ncbi:MAG: H-NS histone family protein [Albidovulum sp.]|nr:H-NS histone family protein [Albidovulum sp.]